MQTLGQLGRGALGDIGGGQGRQQFNAIMQNPQAFAAWYGQQNPQTQQGLVSPGGGGINTPWGTLGNEGRTISALQAGGINPNALNQFINNTSYSQGQPGAQNTNLWDFIPGGSKYGASSYDASGWDKMQPGITQTTQFNPNAYTGQGFTPAGQGGTPQGNASGLSALSTPSQVNAALGNPANGMTWSINGNTGQWQQVPTSSIQQLPNAPQLPAGTPTSMGGAGAGYSGWGNYGQGTGPGASSGGTAQPNTLGSIANPNAPNYALNVGNYLNPMADYMRQQALKNIQSTYAGAGNLLSGPAMQGISNYGSNMALGNAYLPALGAAQQQQGFGYGVNAADRNFAFQQQLANQTIPFSQQMQLAQLGLQGAQSQQGVQNLLAQLGLQGTQGQQGVQNLLATLLGQNALAAGQAAGTGTIGGSNALNSALQQALGNYLGQNFMNNPPAWLQNRWQPNTVQTQPLIVPPGG